MLQWLGYGFSRTPAIVARGTNAGAFDLLGLVTFPESQVQLSNGITVSAISEK